MAKASTLSTRFVHAQSKQADSIAPALLVIAPDVAESSILLRELPSHVRVLRNSPGTMLERIRRALSTIWIETGQRTSLHLVGHGVPGAMSVEDLRLDAESIGSVTDALHDAPLSFLALYGCHTGAGDAGANLVSGLTAALGVPVCASRDLVGRAPTGMTRWEPNGLPAALLPFSAAAITAYPHHLASVTGTAGNDLLAAGDGLTTGNDDVSGLAGNDTISALDGDDLLYGNDGNDTLYAGGGADTLYGGDGNDFSYGETGNDLIYGGTAMTPCQALMATTRFMAAPVTIPPSAPPVMTSPMAGTAMTGCGAAGAMMSFTVKAEQIPSPVVMVTTRSMAVQATTRFPASLVATCCSVATAMTCCAAATRTTPISAALATIPSPVL